MSGSFSQAFSSSKNTSQTDSDQRPYFNDLWSKAKTSFDQRSATPGFGSLGVSGAPPVDADIAGFTPAQLAAQDYATNMATGGYSDQMANVNDAYSTALSGPMNPYVDQLVRSAQRPMVENFQEQVLPSIRSNSISNGGYSSRTGIAEGIAARGLMDSMGDVETGIRSNAYNTGINTMMGALGMAPQMANYNMLPAEWLATVGGQQQGLMQQNIDAPWERLSRYQGLIGPAQNQSFGRSHGFSHSGSYSYGGGGYGG